VLAGEAHKFILVGGVNPTNGRLMDVEPSSDGRREVCSIGGTQVRTPHTPFGSRGQSFIRGRAVLMLLIRKAMQEKWVRNTGGNAYHDDGDSAATAAGMSLKSEISRGGGGGGGSRGETVLCASVHLLRLLVSVSH
jgi:hypothetical protein